MSSIFLCHSSKDKTFVRNLAKALRDAGVHVWIDEAEMRIGDSLTARIGSAIGEMDYFGVVLSHHSVRSEWVQRELQVAVQRELKERRAIVLPLLLEAVEVPPFLRDKLHADFTSPERFADALLNLLRSLGIPDGRSGGELPLPPVEVGPATTLPRKMAIAAATASVLVGCLFYAVQPAAGGVGRSMNIDGYCKSRGGSAAVVVNDPHSWTCSQSPLNLDALCREQHGFLMRARLNERNNAYSWACYPQRWYGFFVPS